MPNSDPYAGLSVESKTTAQRADLTVTSTPAAVGPTGFRQNNAFVIGSVGRMVDVENYPTLVDASPHLRLLIVGDGPARAECSTHRPAPRAGAADGPTPRSCCAFPGRERARRDAVTTAAKACARSCSPAACGRGA